MPEPATVLLLVSGLGALTSVIKQRRAERLTRVQSSQTEEAVIIICA